jgi:sn-glycerol 3-phosphate transport system substrate-binding protein
MKKTTLFLSLLVGFVGTSATLHAAPKKAAKAPAASAPIEIELISQLPGEKRQALAALIERFNQQEKSGSKIVLAERAWDADSLPTMMILDSATEEVFLAGPVRYKPVHAVMQATGEPLQVARGVSGITPPNFVDATGKPVALPVALDTPILFINQDLFRKAGLDPAAPPQTWSQTQEAAGKLYKAGVACPITTVNPVKVLIENMSAWHNAPYATANGTVLAANGMDQVRHLARMASWQKSRYLRIFGHGDEAVGHFAANECGMLLAGQSAMTEFAKDGVSFTVSKMPYYDDVAGAPQNTLADGPALWISAGKSPAEYKLAARFIRFWLEPTQQVDWQRDTGYLPLNRAGAFAAASQSLGDELLPIRIAIEALTHKPATANSRASAVGHSVRTNELMETQLDTVWNDGVAAKFALDTAVGEAKPVGDGKGKHKAK